LQHLTREELITLVDKAIQNDVVLAPLKLEVEEYDAMLQLCGGDARKLYNILELLSNDADGQEVFTITNELVADKVQKNLAIYDKGGEQHYDIASALIKSIRGSDPNAAVYWLARMLEGGEDVKFIARSDY
jgi:putative ATPase